MIGVESSKYTLTVSNNVFREYDVDAGSLEEALEKWRKWATSIFLISSSMDDRVSMVLKVRCCRRVVSYSVMFERNVSIDMKRI